MPEVWLPIAKNPNFGFVSSMGNVKNPCGKIRKAFASKSGYLRVGFSGGKYTLSVHRLVAEAFLGVKDGLQINHKDGNKLNNMVDNLEWVTASENTRHAYDFGLRLNSHRKPKIPHQDFDAIISRIKSGETQRSIAASYGVHPSSLCVFINGRNRPNNFAWRSN